MLTKNPVSSESLGSTILCFIFVDQLKKKKDKHILIYHGHGEIHVLSDESRETGNN